MTVDELIEKVRPRAEGDPFVALRWFISCQVAAEVLDSLGLKDLAFTIMGGGTLGGPFETREDVEAWIEEVEENGDGAWDWLDEAMLRHFGK